FQKHYSIPPPVSSPDLLFFGFRFLFFISYLPGSFRAENAGTDFGRGRGKFCIFMRFRFTCLAVWPSPALRATSSVNVGGSPLSHAAKRHDSSPAGGAKGTRVSVNQVCGKARPQKSSPYHKFSLYLRTYTWLSLRESW